MRKGEKGAVNAAKDGSAWPGGVKEKTSRGEIKILRGGGGDAGRRKKNKNAGLNEVPRKGKNRTSDHTETTDIKKEFQLLLPFPRTEENETKDKK